MLQVKVQMQQDHQSMHSLTVDKYFLNLLSVSCVMCLLTRALVNLEAPGLYPSPYFLQTYGQLGDDIDGRQ